MASQAQIGTVDGGSRIAWLRICEGGAPYTPERAVGREDPWEEGKGKQDEREGLCVYHTIPTPHPSHFPGEKTVGCLITGDRKVEFLCKDSKGSEIVDAQRDISFMVALGERCL